MLLIKNATIIDSENAKYDGKKRDLLIEKGIITDIKTRINKTKIETFDAKGANLSIGWLDIGVQVGDPGYEHREDMDSISQAAAAGGFTAIACQPNTNPVVDSKAEVLYIKNNAAHQLVDLYPIGAVSKDCQGVDITEMYDMRNSGAIAFSDGQQSIQDNGLMMRALQYVKAFDGLIINHPHDKAVGGNGIIHEGKVSTSLGMQGLSNLAEEMMVQRDINLAEYTDSNLHIANISTAGAVEMIRQAKAKGLKVTTSVAAINLVLDDTVLEDFDSNYKVLPPLREQSDIQALKEGLKDGTIDIISSNHTPLEEEAKKLEFVYADFGIIALEITYALCNTYLKGGMRSKKMIQKLGVNPRQLLGLPIPKIAIGEKANFTIFDPNHTWTFSKSAIYSKSANTPFIGTPLKGKVLAVVNNDRYWENNINNK